MRRLNWAENNQVWEESSHQVNNLLQGDSEGDDDGGGLVHHGSVLHIVVLQQVIQQLLLVRSSTASWKKVYLDVKMEYFVERSVSWQIRSINIKPL